MAASALDASTKIYSARVDSVHTESFKVLSGLNRADGEGKAKNSKGGGGEGDDIADDIEPGDKPKRKAVRVTPTVVKHDDDINGPPILYVYEEDPLVRKTTAAFEPGTAKGLLLNQLSVFAGGTLVFDSSDVPEESGRVFEENPTKMLMDTSDLTSTFKSLLENLDDLYICPEAADFQVEQPVRDDGTAQQLRQLPILVEAQSEPYNAESVGVGLERAPSSQMPVMLPMDADNDMYADDGGYEFGGNEDDDADLDDQPRDFDADGNIVASPSAAPVGGSGAPAPAMVPVEMAAASTTTAAATKVPVIVRGQITDGPAQPLSDEIARALAVELSASVAASSSNAWAGPERWGFRKITAKGAVHPVSPGKGNKVVEDEEGGVEGGADAPSGGAKPSAAQRKKKGTTSEQFFIDFTQPADDDWEAAFAPPRKGGTKLTKQQKEKAKSSATVLPPDLHYGTTNLMSLFTKPKWMIPKHQLHWRPIVDPTAQGQTVLSAVMEPEPQSANATEWFDKRQGDAAAVDPLNVSGGGYEDDGGDYGGMDYGGADDDAYPVSSQAAPQQLQLRPARPITELNVAYTDMLVPAPQQLEHIQLGFARVVRAVNVKALKATLWKGIEQRQQTPYQVGKRKSVPVDDEDDDADNDNNEDQQVQPFQELLNDLPKKLPAFEKSNVSVAFCFISLLHLANDHGLELQNENLSHLAIKAGH